MKRFVAFIIALSLLGTAVCAQSAVRGYYRKDGTYVQSYTRGAQTSPASSSSAQPRTPPRQTQPAGGVVSTTSAAPPASTVAPKPDPSTGKTEYVNGYYRKDGTYVAPYYRRPEGTAGTTQKVAPQQAPIPNGSAQNYSTAPLAAQPSTTTPGAWIPAGLTRPGNPSDATSWYQALMLKPDSDYTRKCLSAAVASLSAKDPNWTFHGPNGGVQRDEDGRIARSESAKHAFMKMTGFPDGRPGYIVDHIIPLKRGGCDDPSNMQWQTVEESKAKDKWE